MKQLKEIGILQEIKCGNNFGYVLDDDTCFISTDYKVLLAQEAGVFVPCMRAQYNGKIQLCYLVDEWQALSAILQEVKAETLVTIIINFLHDIFEVKNNGFLRCQNIDLSWEKVFVDMNTLKVKLVYLPIQMNFENRQLVFENELRTNLIHLLNRIQNNDNQKLKQLIVDLANATMPLQEVCDRAKEIEGHTKLRVTYEKSDGDRVKEETLRMVGVNLPMPFEVYLDKRKIIIGKQRDRADIALTFNPMISRMHCTITREENTVYIVDENSVNGTFINQIRMPAGQKRQLQRGDSVRLANSEFKIV